MIIRAYSLARGNSSRDNAARIFCKAAWLSRFIMAKAHRTPRVRAFVEWNAFTERLRRELAIQFYNYEIANGAVGGEARDDSGPAWG